MIDDRGAARNERGEPTETTPQLSDDRLYRALASTRRRRLLYFLLEEGESTVEELATVLTGWEATDTETMGTVRDYNQIGIELKHVHLPLLVDIGLIRHDRESDTVGIERLDPLLVELLSRSVDAGRSSLS